MSDTPRTDAELATTLARTLERENAALREALAEAFRILDTSEVTRVEVIDHTKPAEMGGGRAYVYNELPSIYDPKVTLSLQDDGRTLKVFISKPHTDRPHSEKP